MQSDTRAAPNGVADPQISRRRFLEFAGPAAMLKEVKEKTGLRYMMAESSYYRQVCILARNLFREGGFGELFYSEVEYYHDQVCLSTSSLSYEPDGSKSWRYGYPPMLYPTPWP